MVKRLTNEDISSVSSRYALRIDSSAFASQYAHHGNTFFKAGVYTFLKAIKSNLSRGGMDLLCKNSLVSTVFFLKL